MNLSNFGNWTNVLKNKVLYRYITIKELLPGASL